MEQISQRKVYLRSKTHHHWILHILISLCIKLHFEQTSLNFWTKFAQQRYLWSKTEKVNIIIEFGLFKLVFVAHFSLNGQFWSFGPDLPKKSFSGLKQKKWMPHVFYIILHIQISLVRNFSSSWQTIFVFWIKRYFQSKIEKIKIIIEFRRSKLVSWYQIFALTEKFFSDQIPPRKGCSGRNQKKWTPRMVSCGVNFPHKNGPIPLGSPKFDNFKILPQSICSSRCYMTTMVRQSA